MLSKYYNEDGGRRIYDFVLARHGLKIIGNNTKGFRVLNPFYEDKNPDLKIYFSNNMWRHYDFGAEEYAGNCIDFAALHFRLDPTDKKLADRIAEEIFNGDVIPVSKPKSQPRKQRQEVYGSFKAGEVGSSALDQFMSEHGGNWPEVAADYGVHNRGDEIALQVACPALKVRTIQLTKYRMDGGKLTKKSKTTGKAQTRACPSLKGTIDWVLFGAHLIRPATKRVCIVEAQDTALLCAMKYPAANTVWTSSIGIALKKHREFMLQHRTIIWRFYPDVDAVDQWREECKYLQLHGLQCELMLWHEDVNWQGSEYLGIDPSHADLKDWITLESLKG